MEILIPSLALLLVAVAVAFFVIPRLAPTVLIGASSVVLAIAIYMHVKRFGVMEYERSTWQNSLRAYSSYIVFGLIILGAVGFLAVNTKNAITPSLPSIGTPAIGGGFDEIIGTAVSRVNQLMRKGRITE